MKNQDIYVAHNIFANDTIAIANKLGISEPYSESEVAQIRQLHKLAKDSGLSLNKYLEKLDIGPADRSEARSTTTQQVADPGAFQTALATSASSLVQGQQDFYSDIDRYCSQLEEVAVDAIIDRMNAVPKNTAALTVQRLKAVKPAFFPLAPEGATLPTLNFHSCGTSVLNFHGCGTPTLILEGAEGDQESEQEI